MTYTVSGIAVYSVISEFMAGTKIDDVYKITGFQPFWAILFFVMLCSLFAFGERKKETDFVGLSFMVIIAVSVALFYNGTNGKWESACRFVSWQFFFGYDAYFS